jgi:hypothetical protein
LLPDIIYYIAWNGEKKDDSRGERVVLFETVSNPGPGSIVSANIMEPQQDLPGNELARGFLGVERCDRWAGS